MTATAGDTVATVAWSVPISNGGSEITSYTVSWGSGSDTTSATARSFTARNLVNGIGYTFSVRAVNGNGPSLAAASNSVTPAGPPGTFTFSPTSGKVGTAITITGTNLRNLKGLTFNGAAARFTSNSTGTAVYTSVPAGATNGRLFVSTWAGDRSSGTAFSIKAGVIAPIVSSLSATAGPVGTRVTVTGSNLAGAKAVLYGTTPASYVVTAPGSLVVTIPSATTGTSARITVQTDGGSGLSTPSFVVTPATYRLTTTIAGSGSIATTPPVLACNKTTCSADVSYGTAVTLTPTPAAGYAFAGWSGACTGTGACSTTMTADRTVGSTFKVLTTLDYTGATTAVRSTSATFAVILKANGVPLASTAVSFSFNGTTVPQTTDSNGRASWTLTMPSRAKTYSLVITYAGDTTRASKSITQAIVIT